MKPLKEIWREKIQLALQELAGEQIDPEQVVMETPPSSELGDLAFPMFSYARLLKRAPKEISFEDAQRLLKGTEGSSCPERDRAMVLFLADTGCRVGGLVNLTWADLDLKRRQALLHAL